MTDLEITKLCAEAMGWKHLGAIGIVLTEDEKRGSIADNKYPGKLWCLSGYNDWWETTDGTIACGPCQMSFDPLHDDAQAMALVKKLGVNCSFDPWIDGRPWECGIWIGSQWLFSNRDSDLNRGVCQCVAKMQLARRQHENSAAETR